MDVVTNFAKTSSCNLGYDALILSFGMEDDDRNELSDGEVDEGEAGADQVGDVYGCLECHD